MPAMASRLPANNFMVPVDAKLVSDRDARDEAVSLGRLLEAVEGRSGGAWAFSTLAATIRSPKPWSASEQRRWGAVTNGLTLVGADRQQFADRLRGQGRRCRRGRQR
jgi:hypothetical protein